jgi:hypothetical protein
LIMVIASAPLSRITPIAPMPGGVASATIVSSQPDNLCAIAAKVIGMKN